MQNLTMLNKSIFWCVVKKYRYESGIIRKLHKVMKNQNSTFQF